MAHVDKDTPVMQVEDIKNQPAERSDVAIKNDTYAISVRHLATTYHPDTGIHLASLGRS